MHYLYCVPNRGVPSPSRAVRGCPPRPQNALRRRPSLVHPSGRHDPQLRGSVRPLPRGKGTGSLSQSPSQLLSSPQNGRQRVPQVRAAPPSSCHHSPALQRLTFEFVIGFGLFMKLLPDFEIRHDPRFRLHGSSFPSSHCSKLRTEPGVGGEVAGPLGTPLGLAQRKRASPRGEAGTSGFLSVSDSLPEPGGG